jgi:hypothetical protein
MPTKTGLTRPRAGLGLASNMPEGAVEKRTKPIRNRLRAPPLKSTKPKAHRVGRRGR